MQKDVKNKQNFIITVCEESYKYINSKAMYMNICVNHQAISTHYIQKKQTAKTDDVTWHPYFKPTILRCLRTRPICGNKFKTIHKHTEQCCAKPI